MEEEARAAGLLRSIIDRWYNKIRQKRNILTHTHTNLKQIELIFDLKELL